MISKQDIKGFLQQAADLEAKMAATYSDLHERVRHPRYREAAGRLARSECAHDELIRKLMPLFGEQPDA